MKASEAVFVIADTETTGLVRAEGAELVEIGAWRWVYDQGLVGPFPFETLVNPGCPIPAVVSAIHHLTARDVDGAPDPELARVMFAEWANARGCDAVVAHNAEFDRQFLPDVAPWLCSKRLAQHVILDAPAFGNQVLRYHFGGVDLDLRGQVPHRAIADVIVTAFNLKHIFDAYFAANGIDDLDAMVAFAESPIPVTHWPMGPAEAKGKPMAEIDVGLLNWALRKGVYPDLKLSIEAEIARRRKAP